MGQGGWTVDPVNITLPPGAGPGAPRIVIGPDIPPSIQTFNYAGVTRTTVAAYVEWLDADRFFFRAIATGGGEVAIYHGATDLSAPGQTELVYEVEIMSLNGSGNVSVTREMLGGLLGLDVDQAVMNFNTGTVDVGSAWTFDGITAPRGWRALDSAATNTAAIGAEAVVHTITDMTWRDGRAYEVLIGGRYRAGSLGQILFQIRETNLAGSVLAVYGEFPIVTVSRDFSLFDRVLLNFEGSSGFATDIVLTMQKIGGGTAIMVGSTTRPRYFEVRDVGSSADNANSSPIV